MNRPRRGVSRPSLEPCARGYLSAADFLDHAAEIWSKSCAPLHCSRVSRPSLNACALEACAHGYLIVTQLRRRRDERPPRFSRGCRFRTRQCIGMRCRACTVLLSSTSNVPAAQALGQAGARLPRRPALPGALLGQGPALGPLAVAQLGTGPATQSAPEERPSGSLDP